jgi:hypothetical protein
MGKRTPTFIVSYTNEIGGCENPLEAAKECLKGITDKEALTFDVLNCTTQERTTVDLLEDDEDAVLPSEPSESDKTKMEMVVLLRQIVSDLSSMDNDELSKFEKNLLRDTKKILAKV